MKTIRFKKMGYPMQVNNEILDSCLMAIFVNNQNVKFFIQINLENVYLHSGPKKKEAIGIGNFTISICNLYRVEYQVTELDPIYREFKNNYTICNGKQSYIDFVNKICDCSFGDMEIV
jgi:hypothetical protein